MGFLQLLHFSCSMSITARVLIVPSIKTIYCIAIRFGCMYVVNQQDEHVLVVTCDFDALCVLCGSINNLPRNYNIYFLVDRFNVSPRHDNPFENFHWCEAGPVTCSLCIVLASWGFIPPPVVDRIVMMICCLFSVADRAILWAGCGL